MNLLVRQKEERSLVRESWRKLDHLGFAITKVHNEFLGRGEV
jgi:hypothetical protein